jgi:glutamate decarboxylase
MSPGRYTIDPKDIVARVDENTIAAGAVIGTTFIGEADPVADIARALDALQKKTGLDVPIHVDAASGGFILPFSDATEKWDFRLKRVASINASGHKYGLVYPGLGWLVFRDKSYLPEELVFSVNYLGGAQPTYTFNFSRGSAMIQAQYYNFLRLGRRGYADVVRNMLDNARHLNDLLVADGRFEIMNPRLPEPVVTWRIKDSVDIDPYQLADRLRMHGWIVPAYSLPPDAQNVVVLRAVVRNDMSRPKVEALAQHIAEECAYLEQHQAAPDPGRTGAEAQHRRC